MSETLKGGCLCGACRYDVAGPPDFAVQCYCSDCRKVSGGGHLPQLAFPADGLTRSGPVGTYSTRSDAGNDLAFMFCKECGSPLFKTTSKLADTVIVMVGSLDDPAIYQPQYKAFEEARLPWDEG